jgi:hypothetical protein
MGILGEKGFQGGRNSHFVFNFSAANSGMRGATGKTDNGSGEKSGGADFEESACV